MIRIFALIFLFAFTTPDISCTSKSRERHGSNDYRPVARVVDGDTFYIDDGSPKGEKIRLIGVDAPESRKSFRKAIGAYGKEAKIYLTELLRGKKVRLEYDIDHTDQYGRTLAYVYLQDGTFVNANLVKNGYAMVMTVPPNVKFAREFINLQQEARNNNRGLWNESLKLKF